MSSVHDVASYAPPGYRLARSDYADGCVTHIFEHPLGSPLKCAVSAGEDEREALARFQQAAMVRLGLVAPPKPALVPSLHRFEDDEQS